MYAPQCDIRAYRYIHNLHKYLTTIAPVLIDRLMETLFLHLGMYFAIEFGNRTMMVGLSGEAFYTNMSRQIGSP
ncbi:MAG: hypothetical protein ETSY2_03400 [Candidatus Entotheonella gemina]|uniref:Uncharacterized protein n=1 Tax=Candidatus Entotheonella gemina TaxID=1429439 RepID=W4MFW5_9BACT|nr:MAG: hypothetical protein ETSY2_03400 [Candidatus Entotheonella gemina]